MSASTMSMTSLQVSAQQNDGAMHDRSATSDLAKVGVLDILADYQSPK